MRGAFPLAVRGNRRLAGFARLGAARGRFNMFDRFASAGLTFSGWVPGRDEDAFGLAFAGAFTAAAYRVATGAGASELAFEATYRARLPLALARRAKPSAIMSTPSVWVNLGA